MNLMNLDHIPELPPIRKTIVEAVQALVAHIQEKHPRDAVRMGCFVEEPPGRVDFDAAQRLVPSGYQVRQVNVELRGRGGVTVVVEKLTDLDKDAIPIHAAEYVAARKCPDGEGWGFVGYQPEYTLIWGRARRDASAELRGGVSIEEIGDRLGEIRKLAAMDEKETAFRKGLGDVTGPIQGLSLVNMLDQMRRLAPEDSANASAYRVHFDEIVRLIYLGDPSAEQTFRNRLREMAAGKTTQREQMAALHGPKLTQAERFQRQREAVENVCKVADETLLPEQARLIKAMALGVPVSVDAYYASAAVELPEVKAGSDPMVEVAKFIEQSKATAPVEYREASFAGVRFRYSEAVTKVSEDDPDEPVPQGRHAMRDDGVEFMLDPETPEGTLDALRSLCNLRLVGEMAVPTDLLLQDEAGNRGRAALSPTPVRVQADAVCGGLRKKTHTVPLRFRLGAAERTDAPPVHISCICKQVAADLRVGLFWPALEKRTRGAIVAALLEMPLPILMIEERSKTIGSAVTRRKAAQGYIGKLAMLHFDGRLGIDVEEAEALIAEAEGIVRECRAFAATIKAAS